MFLNIEVEHAAGVRPAQEIECADLTFKLIVKTKDKSDILPQTITLMAPSAHEKAAWTSDISQVCIISSTLFLIRTKLIRIVRLKSPEK